jgi:transcription elongation factor Elf1/integrase
MSNRKYPPISVHPTLHSKLEVDWQQEYNNEFNCPYCNHERLTYYSRQGKNCNLGLRCCSCKKHIYLTCLIPGARRKHIPVSTHQINNGKLEVNWEREYNNEFNCPHCDHTKLTFHYAKSNKHKLMLDCSNCRQSTSLSCIIRGTGKIYDPISTHKTDNGELKVNWYLEYKDEFDCPRCNHEHLIYYSRQDKTCDLILECSSCRKVTYLTCRVPGAGITHAPVSIHKIGKAGTKEFKKVNWYLEYKNEFNCPECNHEHLIYSYDTSKSCNLSLECKSCHKTTALTCPVPVHIYNYKSNLECPNPLCTKLGHNQQKGWIYKIGEKKNNHKCHFCKISFNPDSADSSSWVGIQKLHKLPSFNFDDNRWDISYFGYQHDRRKNIYFSYSNYNWYIVLIKEYIYYLLKSQTFSFSGIRQRLTALEQFGKSIDNQKIQNISEITRTTILHFLDSHKKLEAVTLHGKLTFLKAFFEYLNIDNKQLIRSRDFPKLKNNDPDWLDEVTRQAINNYLEKIPAPIAHHYLVQAYLAARPGDICQLNFDCLEEENGKWYVKFLQGKSQRWHRILASRKIRKVIEKQQQWIRQTFGEDYPYLFCHFRSIIQESYPTFSSIKPLPWPPSVSASHNPMVRIIRILINKENVLDANGQKPNFTGKITRSSRLQEVRTKYGMEAAQLYADHQKSSTTFQHYAPPTREQIAEVDLPFQELLMNPDNKFLPWQSLPESLLKNPKAHELDLEIAPRLVVYGHCTLDPKTPCPVNLYPKCYGCSSFRPSTGKLPLYERQYQGEQQRLTDAEKAGAELASEEVKATIEAMDKWLPELRRLADG